MRNKIVNIFIEKKRKIPIINSIVIPQKQPNDDFRQHTLQKPIQTGYSNNQP
jgi:hypothetical protein